MTPESIVEQRPRSAPAAPDPRAVSPTAACDTTRRDLTALFDPRTVAVVGASDDPAKYGNWLATRMLRGPRPVFLVNARRPTVLGRTAWPTLTAVGEAIDLAVIAVPAAGFEKAVDDAIRARVKAVVAFTAGLGEVGGDARVRQDALVGRLRSAGTVLLGPNCLGVLDNTTALDATVDDFPSGTVSIISQSGNIAIDIGAHLAAQGLGVARFASLGNGADLEAADLIDSCIEHEGTRAIALYCEGFGDGREFARAAARAADAGKPIVLLSVGGSAASARGAASHTGSMVTPTVVLESVCRATGVELVSTPYQMAVLLQALIRTRLPRNRRVTVLADGGGHASVASDYLNSVGLAVEQLSPSLAATLAAELPPTASVCNPIDVAGGGEQDITCFARVLDRLTTHVQDAVLMTGYFGGYGDNYDPAMRPAEIQAGRDIAAVAAASGASLIAQTIYADSAPAHALRAGGVAVYRNVEDAGWALARLATRAACSRRGVPEPGIEAAPLIDTGYWPARRALAAAGVPFGRAAEVATLSELRDAAAGLRFPLVLKALVDEHKSDRGGVVLGIADQAALERAWLDIQTRLAPPTVSVEEQLDLSEAVELIVGVRRDPAFGPIVMVGLGGVHTELFGDIRCALGPVTTAVADELLRSLKGAALLTGFRGRPALAVDAAAALIVALSRFADAHPELREVECNPVAVTRDAVVALDARIVLS